MVSFFCVYFNILVLLRKYMNSWAVQRQIGYLIIFGAVLIVGFLWYYAQNVYQAPSCSDLIKNQSEVGVDCGGPCFVLCDSQVNNFVILWSRSLQSVSGSYDAVALVENSNSRGGVEDLAYSFKLYDQDNVLIAERTGRTYSNANETFLIFERRVFSGDRVPTRTFLTLERVTPWTMESVDKPDLSVVDRHFELVDKTPKLKAVLVNKSFFDVEDIIITALLFDENDNAVASSKTEVSFLPRDEQKDISFIFPQKVDKTPARIEVLPRVKTVGTGQ